MALARKQIEGSIWIDVLYPKAKTEEDFKTEKLFNEVSEEIEGKLDKYEHFFNKVEPSIDWKTTKGG